MDVQVNADNKVNHISHHQNAGQNHNITTVNEAFENC
jgi:hypothetical protein